MINENDVVNNLCTSHWLKNQIAETKSRDIVDALNDIEILTAILNQRLDKMNP